MIGCFVTLFFTLSHILHIPALPTIRNKCIRDCNDGFEELLFDSTGSEIVYLLSRDPGYIRRLCSAYKTSLGCYETCPKSTQKTFIMESEMFSAMSTMCLEEECYMDEERCAQNGELPCKAPKGYLGSKNTTRNGIPCQNWMAQVPHGISHNYRESDIQEDWALGNHSFCRIADFDSPWCYTMDPQVRWDYCFDSCQACVDEDSECSYDKMSACRVPDAYLGPKNTTWNGRSCQKWTRTEPNKPLEKYQESENMVKWHLGDHSECRVTDFQAPWCYVEDDKQRWDFCFLTCDPAQPIDKCIDAGKRCAWDRRKICADPKAYHGDKNTTRSGWPCLKWSSDTVRRWGSATHADQAMNATSSESIESGMEDWGLGEHNYCRVTNWHAPWCFASLNGSVIWEYCFDSCSEDGIAHNGLR